MRHIVALRGDPPPGQAYEPHPGGYHYASDLVAGLRKVADFEISVAAYPEVHPGASSPVADLENLKRKLDAGATRAITQYFFDTSTYLRFLDLCLAAGITAPIVPGIMPVSNFAQAVKFSDMCGASVPGWMGRLFEGTENDPETRRMVGMVIAAEQVRLLQANGVDEFHFYTLNRPDLTYAIAHVLGVRALTGDFESRPDSPQSPTRCFNEWRGGACGLSERVSDEVILRRQRKPLSENFTPPS